MRWFIGCFAAFAVIMMFCAPRRAIVVTGGVCWVVDPIVKVDYPFTGRSTAFSHTYKQTITGETSIGHQFFDSPIVAMFRSYDEAADAAGYAGVRLEDCK